MQGKMLLVGFIVLLNACNNRPVEKYFPGKDSWRIASPGEVGISPENLDSALAYLKFKCFGDGLSEVIIIKDGYIVYQGDSVHKQHNIWSCTKSITSLVLGLLIDEGKCTLDTRLSDYLPFLREDYPEARFRHFATMTSGYNAVGNSRWNEASADWSETPFVPEKPSYEPGEAYSYWDEAQMVYGAALTRVAGKDLRTYLDEKVFRHIEFGSWNWLSEPYDDDYYHVNGCTGVEVSALQLARLGYLYLNEGNWKGQQLVPVDWIKASMTNQVAIELKIAQNDRRHVDGRGNYGYNWWTKGVDAGGNQVLPSLPGGSAYMSGLNNNVCFVIPGWNMVFVRTGVDGNPAEGKSRVYDEFFRILSGGDLNWTDSNKNGK